MFSLHKLLKAINENKPADLRAETGTSSLLFNNGVIAGLMAAGFVVYSNEQPILTQAGERKLKSLSKQTIESWEDVPPLYEVL